MKASVLRSVRILWWRLLRMAAACAAAVCPILAAGDGPPARYDSVGSFIASMQGTVRGGLDQGYGELSGKGRRDWAGLVSTADAGPVTRADSLMPKLVVLTQDGDGKYQAAVTLQTEGGGTGNHGVEEVHIARSSVYVSSSWIWHGCGGGATHQFKYYKGQWRLIGLTIQRYAAVLTTDENGQDSYDDGDKVTIDRNVLTGDVIFKLESPGKKAVIKHQHVAPEVLLFQDYDEEQGSLPQFDGYAMC